MAARRPALGGLSREAAKQQNGQVQLQKVTTAALGRRKTEKCEKRAKGLMELKAVGGERVKSSPVGAASTRP